MTTGTARSFHLPTGWTLRKVATAIVREWLPPFRVDPAPKAARWVVQSIMEENDKGAPPLWEPGISTQEYEERLDKADLGWAIRASAGRGKGTILARLALSKEEPETFQVECYQDAFPDTLFDAEKLDEFLKQKGAAGTEALFDALLTEHGFEHAHP